MSETLIKTGLKFTPGNHSYTLDGNRVTGVTTILGVLDKSRPLMAWAAKLVATEAVNNHDSIGTDLYTVGPEAVIKQLAGAPNRKRDTAADRGTDIHTVAEDVLNRRPIELPGDDPNLPAIQSALRFIRDWKIKPLYTELPVASRADQWAGTADLIAGYTNPHTGESGVGLFDWKSGKSAYPEFAFQFAAYAHADFGGLNPVEQGKSLVFTKEVDIPKIDATFGVMLARGAEDAKEPWQATEYAVYPMEHGRHVYEEFLAIKRVFELKKRADGNYKIPGSGYVGAPLREVAL